MSEKYNSLFSIVVTAKMGHALQTRARGGLNLNNLESGTYLIRVYKTNSIIGTAKIILEN